jgi:hypothetical protein
MVCLNAVSALQPVQSQNEESCLLQEAPNLVHADLTAFIVMASGLSAAYADCTDNVAADVQRYTAFERHQIWVSLNPRCEGGVLMGFREPLFNCF